MAASSTVTIPLLILSSAYHSNHLADMMQPRQNKGWAGENEFGAIQNMLQNMAEQTRKLSEENRKMREEIRVHGEELERTQGAMRLVFDVQRIQEENRKAQEEKERVHRQNHAVGIQKVQKVMEQILKVQEMQEENRRIQEENRESELRRSQELVEEIMETQRIQEDYRKFQEENERTFSANIEDGLQREKDVAEQVLKVQRAQSGIREIQSQGKEEDDEKRIIDEMAKRIMEAANRRTQERPYLLLEAERCIHKGIPVEYPTGEEIQALRKGFQYTDGSVHFAVIGVSRSGKSSLINAIRGCSDWSIGINPNKVKIRTSKKSEEIRRYCDPIRLWALWYDVPGPSAFKCSDWRYFNKQGLFIFDIIIIVVGYHFTRTELEVLLNCYRFGIPTFLVRSKADQDTNGYIYDERGNIEDEGWGETRDEIFKDAQDKYIKYMREKSESMLREAGLPPQKIYIVARNTLQSLSNGSKDPVNIIDEVELMRDLFDMAKKRMSSPGTFLDQLMDDHCESNHNLVYPKIDSTNG